MKLKDLICELPYLEDVNSYDFQIEKYPISKSKKTIYITAYFNNKLAAYDKDKKQWYRISQQNGFVKIIGSKGNTILPDYWKKYLIIAK